MAFGKLKQTSKNTSPILEEVHITGSILHSFATITYHERFITKNEDLYEIYINPPEGCVIYNIKAKYNDQITEFIVHKLEEPVSYGQYSQSSNSDAVFLTIGKINADTIVTIEITCTFTAELLSPNSFTFNFPSDSDLLLKSFSMDITSLNEIKKDAKITTSEGSLTLKNNHLILPRFIITKNFKITFEFPNPIESSAYSSKIGKFNYIGLSFHPTEINLNGALKQEIYLLIDCSGSMEGSKIKNAQIALQNFIKSLPKNCYFNILRFGSTFQQMFEHSVPNNKKNISDSLNFSKYLEADLGCTNIYSPLMSIINEEPKKGYVRQVFALTDGIVDDPANVLAICTANRHRMRVFPFGIGNDVDHAFLKELAKSTKGEAHFIDNKNSISNDVLLALKSSQVPALVNAQIHIEGVDTFELAPHPIPSLFANSLTHVIVRYESKNENTGDSILVNSECGDSTYENMFLVEKVKKSIDFHKLFAYHNIRDMEDRLMNMEKQSEAELIRENIVELSVQSEIVSSFTGMFTVINGIEQKSSRNQREMNLQCQIQTIMDQSCFSCQQQITQKQFRNQTAFSQSSRPIQQQKNSWGRNVNDNDQSLYNNIEQLLINDEQKVPPDNEIEVNVNKYSSGDKFVDELLMKQNTDGSWCDSYLINLLIKTRVSSVQDLFREFSVLEERLNGLSDSEVITVLVINWFYSQRENLINSIQDSLELALNFLYSKSAKKIPTIEKNEIPWNSNKPSKFMMFLKSIFG